MNILALNPGSSTLKFALFAVDSAPVGDKSTSETRLAGGTVDRVGTEAATLQLERGGKRTEPTAIAAPTIAQAVEQVLVALQEEQAGEIAAVGCRIVHGGARFTAPTRITPEALDEIRALSELAPLHNPAGVAVIETVRQRLPDTPVVVVFDTAFHHTLPAAASTYALPLDYSERLGLRRYGFHGISHRYVSEKLQALTGKVARCITCHLGNGASVCAIRDGVSIDTSMGLTPLEGLIMGTRSGDIDPGLLLHLLRTQPDMTAETLDDLLNRQSGLKGLSGRSGDVRDLEQAAAQGDPRAAFALDAFAYRVSKYIGAYAVALEGLEALVFTGGIGEHAALMRERICRRLGLLGIMLDPERNGSAASGEGVRISPERAPVGVWVIPTDEERQIARETFATVHGATAE